MNHLASYFSEEVTPAVKLLSNEFAVKLLIAFCVGTFLRIIRKLSTV